MRRSIATDFVVIIPLTKHDIVPYYINLIILWERYYRRYLVVRGHKRYL